MFAETAFRVVTSGFYGAFTQAFRRLEPPWLAFTIILVPAPACEPFGFVVSTEDLIPHPFRSPIRLPEI